MQASDRHQPRGILAFDVRRRGRVIERVRDENLIVTSGREADALLLGGDAVDKTLATIGFGEGATATDLDDTALTNAFTKAIDGITYPAAGQVRAAFQLTVLEGNGLAIIEFGLFLADGTLYARKVRSGAIEKADDVDITGTWTIIF